MPVRGAIPFHMQAILSRNTAANKSESAEREQSTARMGTRNKFRNVVIEGRVGCESVSGTIS